MTGNRALVAGASLAAPFALFPLFLRPQVALALAVGGLVAWLACNSVAYPLALAGVPAIMFGIFGDNPLPEGVVSVGLAGAVVLAIAVTVQRGRAVPPPAVLVGAPLLLTLLLLCMLVLREPAAPETDYGRLKTAFFVVSNIVFLAGGIFVGWNAQRLRLLLLATLTVSVTGAALLVLYVAGGGDQSILPVALTFSDGDHSISMGRQMAAGMLVALALALAHEDAAGRLVAIAALPLLATALIASAARGPVVALIAGALALLALGLSDRVARRRLLAIVIAATTAATMIQLVVPQASVVRSFSFASTDVEGSSSGRTEMWEQAIRLISEHPTFGIGTGGFADVNPQMIYPHNIVLELGAELGVAGMLLLAAFLGHAMLRLARAYGRATRDERVMVAAVVALFVAALSNAMLSYALHGNWEVWLWAGVGTAMAARILGDRSSRAPEPGAG